jgi:hypothetical protein
MKPNQSQKTLKENRLNNMVLCFIRNEIYNINPPVDEDYAKEFISGQFKKLLKGIIEDKLLKNLYHKYKLGFDILEIIEDDKYYKERSFHEFPELFIAQPIENNFQKDGKNLNESSQIELNGDYQEVFSLDGIEMPPNYTFIESELPKVKAKFIAKVKSYIFFLELNTWIEKNGFSIPVIEFDSITEVSPTLDSTNSKDEEPEEEIDKDLMTVKSFLSFLVEEKICDEENYDKLVNLIYNFLVKDEDVALEDIVKLKNGSSRRLGSALGEIFREIASAPLSYEYLLLGKKNINQFSEVKLNMENFQKSTLYKYYADKRLCYKKLH